MNTPIESSTVLAGRETTAETIEDHAMAVLGHAQALVELSRECNDDEIAKVSEAIVLELAGITHAQGLELREILPHETCEECERPCLDFRRSSASGRVTCTTCLVIEGSASGAAKLLAARERELDMAWSQGHASGKRTAAENAEEARNATPPTASHTRTTVLDGARHATMQREDHHGAPGPMFVRIARLWAVVLDRVVLPHEVALCLAALKLARAVQDPTHGDNWVDLAGYAACGGEVASARRSA